MNDAHLTLMCKGRKFDTRVECGSRLAKNSCDTNSKLDYVVSVDSFMTLYDRELSQRVFLLLEKYSAEFMGDIFNLCIVFCNL